MVLLSKQQFEILIKLNRSYDVREMELKERDDGVVEMYVTLRGDNRRAAKIDREGKLVNETSKSTTENLSG